MWPLLSPKPPNWWPPNLAWVGTLPLFKMLSQSDKEFSLPSLAAPPLGRKRLELETSMQNAKLGQRGQEGVTWPTIKISVHAINNCMTENGDN